MGKKLVHGLGINDADYQVSFYTVINGKQKMIYRCPVYKCWKNILKRCNTNIEAYNDVDVCDEWKLFSNFREWVINEQPEVNWEHYQIDKDLLYKGNRLYSPETCVFIHPLVNQFLKECKGNRGKYKIGVCKHKKSGKYQSDCSDPFKKRKGYIGWFNSEEEAHEAWRLRKHQYACELAESEYVTTSIVRDTLKVRFLK